MWGWHDMTGADWLWMSFGMAFWLVLLGLVIYIAVKLALGGPDRKP